MKSLLISLSIPIQLSYNLPISLIVGCEILRELQPWTKKKLFIKWPNDLYTLDGKIGGILVEYLKDYHNKNILLIGVGINIYAVAPSFAGIFNAYKPYVISMYFWYMRIYTAILSVLSSAQSGQWRNIFNQSDFLQGKKISMTLSGQNIIGHYEGINPKGHIGYRIKNGTIHYASDAKNIHIIKVENDQM